METLKTTSTFAHSFWLNLCKSGTEQSAIQEHLEILDRYCIYSPIEAMKENNYYSCFPCRVLGYFYYVFNTERTFPQSFYNKAHWEPPERQTGQYFSERGEGLFRRFRRFRQFRQFRQCRRTAAADESSLSNMLWSRALNTTSSTGKPHAMFRAHRSSTQPRTSAA